MQLKLKFWIRLKQFFTILFVLHCWEVSGASSPIVLTPLEASKSIKKLSAHNVGFGYSGLAFYSNKLYASCNIGLLEIEGSFVRKAYQWDKSDSVVEGPWLDLANGQLWIGCHNNSLARFDGKIWQSMPIPWPTNSTVTRGNFLVGYGGFSSSNCFWFGLAENAWPWDASLRKWKEQIDLPTVKNATRFGGLQRLFLFGDKPFVVVGYEPSWAILQPDRDSSLTGDTVQYFEQSWLQVTNTTTKPFFVKQTVSVSGNGFLRTYDGEILQVDSSKISKLESPGFCEALAVTSAGNLLASFHNLGVYELTKEWKLRFKAPYPSTDGEHWVYLAESDGRIALSVSPIPQLVADKFVYSSSAAFWMFDGQKLEEISFPKK